MCGDADKVHSLIVSTTHSLQRRPGLSWTCKPNGGNHAELKRIGRSSGRMVSVANTLPARVLQPGQKSFRRYIAVSLFLHMQRLVTVRRRSILCPCQCFWCMSVQRCEGRLSARIRRRTTPCCALSPAPLPASSHRPIANKY